ncbi:hypothetical protein EW146_g6954 [Bondarzewia mesenterica]|uniref:Major facilitator superfamily (MFS) profile domain-containing protein n=1 Tax=Bondarzewia mesenterica TaxID=1095465 RepID=A0A4S4LNZ2_9AGAM|nr:hypothetical protein EW146_g6954 [Bondarzewia mesenterica]
MSPTARPDAQPEPALSFVGTLPAQPHSPSTSSKLSLENKSAGDIYTSDATSPSDLADPDEEGTRFTDWLFRRNVEKQDLDAIATKRSVYDDPSIAKHYYPSAKYENRHRFDPSARWTYREEKALVRKIDLRVMLWTAISFSALNLDRYNLSQANTDNFLPNLGMTTDDYNLGNSVFKIAFLCAELPSQMVSKRLGPDRWIPMQMCAWSIITFSQFWLNGRGTFLATRALLGGVGILLTASFKAGECAAQFVSRSSSTEHVPQFHPGSDFIPILLLYQNGAASEISSFLDVVQCMPNCLQFHRLRRAAYAWNSREYADINGSYCRGLITLVIGITTFFMMPPSPTQTKAWFRPNGWFTEREEIISVNRVLRDDPTKGDMHNREGLTWKRLWTAVCDYDLWPLYLLGLMFGIPITPPSNYLTLSLRHLGFSTFKTNLLSIPSQFAGIVSMFALTFISERVNDRAIVSSLEDLWALPFLIALYCLPANPNPWIFYVRQIILIVFIAFVLIHRKGNRGLIIISCVNLFILYPSAKAYYVWRNRQRSKIWDAMTPEQRSEYLATTKDMGNRRLDFRFAH